MGRLASVVSSRAALNGSSTPLTHTLRVSFHGFMKLMYLPLGEICAAAISGLPKKISRSMMGGRPAFVAVAGALAVDLAGALVCCATASEPATIRHRTRFIIFFMVGNLISS